MRHLVRVGLEKSRARGRAEADAEIVLAAAIAGEIGPHRGVVDDLGFDRESASAIRAGRFDGGSLSRPLRFPRTMARRAEGHERLNRENRHLCPRFH